MTTEQKAAAYDEAITKIKYVIEHGVSPTLNKTDLENIFPELKESEDEMIRKELIKFVKSRGGFKQEYIAWLEKQGEQKPADKAEPKFHEGDIIKPKDGSHEPWQIMQVDILDKKYRFKDGYVIPFSHEDNYELVEQKSAWSEEDLPEFESYLCLMFQKFRTKGICTNGEIIDYVKEHSQKLKDTLCHAWSEEDENNILFLTSIIEECFKNKEKITLCGDTVCANFTKENVIDRLKSLRPQNHWRPSEEQMDALNDVISSRDIKYDVLSELWKDLKQLK